MNNLLLYFSYPFVRYALIVALLVAVSSSLLGVTLVLKRYSFIGDGLSHVAFGATAIASVMNLSDNLFLVLPVTVVSAILLLRTGKKRMAGDSAIAMLSVSAMAIGYLVMNIFSTAPNLSGDVCTTLFGSTSLLTLSVKEVWICVVLSLLVIGIFILFFNRFFTVTFDDNFSKATGIRTDAYNLLLSVVIALVIVMGMKLVGSLLISALVIFPALTAMRLFKSFKAVTVYSGIHAFVCALLGMLISIGASTPSGATIIAVNIVVFAIASVIGKLRGTV